MNERSKPEVETIHLGAFLTESQRKRLTSISGEIIDRNGPLKRQLGEDEGKIELFKGLVGLLFNGHHLNSDKIRAAGLKPEDILKQANSIVRNDRVSHPRIVEAGPSDSDLDWDKYQIGGTDPWEFLGDGSGRDSEG